MNLKQMLKDGQVIAAGVYDCYSSRAMEHVGYKAVVLCGGAVAGLNDENLVTLEDVAWTASRMTIFEEIPVLADARNGYGESAAHAARAVERLEGCGVQGIIIDDSTNTIDGGKGILSPAGWEKRLRAALNARQDCLIIAAVCGKGPIEERIDRCLAAQRAGADLVCIRHLETEKEVEAFAKAVPTGKMWYDACHCDNVPMKFAQLKALGFEMIYQSFAARSARWGMTDFGKRTFADKHTVYHDEHDFDGLVDSKAVASLYNFAGAWIPFEQRMNDLGEVGKMTDMIRIEGE